MQRTLPVIAATPDAKDSDKGATVAEALPKILYAMGINQAFGVSGGALASLWGTLSNSPIHVIHCRHEAGATFAAVEAYFAANRPTLVFTTAGPGITNALTGMLSARDEGAKILLISASTPAPQRGRFGIQDLSLQNHTTETSLTLGAPFNLAASIESAEQLPALLNRIAHGFADPQGFVAHLSISPSVQMSVFSQFLIPSLPNRPVRLTCDPETITKCLEYFREPIALWVGFGARHCSHEIIKLAEALQAPVMGDRRLIGVS
ncbi:MAG TPA: thiamine pyrophosphate-binding protein [Oligoflexus sp.]|uniref:thiamine pyrophosphate-binding protein n=1 Tax=Oligoflexus sp. TaxID=1971216 RepID=UPI002D55860F|nr:thiamine pyrophosphate-binding protein [Oligoflexus sp.]HYX38081.1 thiamine pyrophosphate-binding protein [Oligoflexus sp.]